MPPQSISGDIKQLPPEELRKAFCASGITRIDTAARYQNGESERILGRSGLSKDFTIDTKVFFAGPKDANNAPAAIVKSINNSLEVLGVEQVNVLYCHGPDFITPIAETAKAFDEQYRAGKFKQVGVSNFSPQMLQQWLDVANENGYVKPTFYQGQYNLLSRAYEKTLFPLLRANGIAFAAFSPLAGGFLLGNFTKDGLQCGYRFSVESPYKGWYDHVSMHHAVSQLRALSEKSGLGMDELSLRWLKYHSVLQDGDVVIMGASKVEQITASVKKTDKGPLDDDVAQAMDALWRGCEEDAARIVDYEPKP